MNPAADMPLLQVSISADYPNLPSVLRDVAFEIRHREILGIAGESGSGKSTLALAILNLLKFRRGRVRGSVRLNAQDLCGLSERELRKIRGRDVSFVPQNPVSALNPAMRIRLQLREAWKAHRDDMTGFKTQLAEIFESVSLPADSRLLSSYPSQLSVGQAQRVLIGMAILHRPSLIVADEPTSALDALTQAEVLSLFRRLNRDLGTAVLFISHDLAAAASLCERIGILHRGELVEIGPAERVFWAPSHPYTRQLVAALPSPRQPEVGTR